jgi:hypothetical protein
VAAGVVVDRVGLMPGTEMVGEEEVVVVVSAALLQPTMINDIARITRSKPRHHFFINCITPLFKYFCQGIYGQQCDKSLLTKSIITPVFVRNLIVKRPLISPITEIDHRRCLTGEKRRAFRSKL